MPKIYKPSQLFGNGLGLTDAASDPQYAQCNEDNPLFITLAKPHDWDGSPMTMKIFGGASGSVVAGAKCTVRSGLGTYSASIGIDNPDDAAISTSSVDGFMVLDTVSLNPIGSGDLMLINIEYFSETYGASLYILGLEITYSAV